MSTVQRFFATATVASMLMSAALPVGAATAAELQAQIDALMATLNALQGQVQTAQGTTPSAGAPAACSGISFSRSLTVGSSGTDVKCLQALLNQSSDTQVASSGAGSPGKETTTFGSLTRAAVIKFQEKYASEVLTPIGLTAGTGFVGAKSRAKLSSMLTGGVAVTPTPAPTPTPGAAPAPAPATGVFTVNAAADSPVAKTLGASSAYNTVLKVKVSAGASAVDVTSVTVERAGLSIDTNVAGILVVDENGMRKGNVVTLADNKATIPFTADPVKIAAGGSATLSIQVHMAAGATAGTLQVNLTGMSGSPAGLPINGNLHTLSATAGILGGLTLDVVSQTTVTVNVDIGQKDHILTKFRFAANANEDVKISRVTLFQNGTAADEDLTNWELVDPNGNVLATVAKATGKVVDFMLATPYVLAKGTNRDLTVRVDVASGSSRTGQAIIQNDYDVVATGASTGLGILATAAGTVDTAIPIGDITTGNAGFNQLTVAAGTLTIAKAAGSPSGTFGIGGANITLAQWNLEAKGEDIQLQRADFSITGSTVAADFTGTVKLMTDAGQVLYSVTSSTAALYDDDVAGADVVTLSTYYTIPAGQTLKLKLVADASTTISDGDTGIGNLSDIYFKRMTSNTFGTASAAAFVTGNTLTASVATLTVVNNAALGNVTVIEGGSDVLIGSYLLQTSSSEGVNVSSVNLDITFAGAAAIGALSNLKLKRADTGAQIGSTTATPAASNTITVSGQLNIPASTTIQVDAYVNMSTAVSDGGTDDTVSTNVDANDVTGTGLVSGTTIQGPGATVTSRTITAVEGGTLTVAIDSSGAASSQFFSPGLTGVEMARVKLASTVENMKIQRLELRSLQGTANVATVKLLGTGLSSDPTTPLTTGNAVFTFAAGSEVTVPAYGSRVLTAVADTSAVSTLVGGQVGVLGFGTMNAIGAGSGLTVQESITGTAGTNFYTAGTNAYSGDLGDVLYFTVTADAGTNTAAGFYSVTTDEDAVNLATGDLALNGGAVQTSWAAGDIVSKLTKVESVAGNGTAGVAYAVGDLIYVYDSDDNESAFAIVTTGVDSGDVISGLVFSPAGAIAIAAAADRVTKITNANSLVGNTMRYEEVEAVITLSSSSPSGAQSPNSSQTVAIFNVKASGSRDMTVNSLTVEKSGSNTPEQFVVDLSLYDGTTRIARVATTTVAGTNDDANTNGVNADTTINVCTGATTGAVDEVGNITAAESATVAIGDKLTIVTSGGADADTSTATVTDSDGTLAACDGNGATGRVLTFDGNIVIDADDTTVTVRNNRVHFDASQANTNDVALAELTITAGQTTALTVKADTTSVRSGVSSGTVTFGVTIPGVAGPLQVGVVDAPTADTDQNQVEGLNWDYTPLGGGTAVYKTESDSYPVSANTLTY